MNGIVTKIHWALFAVILIIVGVIFFRSRETVFDETQQQVTTYMDGWKSNDKETTFYNYLPEHLKVGSGISFFTKNQYLEVLIGDKTIYSYLPPIEKRWETPGNQWHFIELPEKYAKEKITLHFHVKDNKNVRLPKILIGKKDDLFRRVIVKSMIPLFFSFALIALGFIFCIAWVINRKKVGIDIQIFYLGLLTIGIGIWSGIQTQILQLFIGNTYDLAILLNFLLLLVQYPVMKFAFKIYGGFVNDKKRFFTYLLEFYFIILFISALGCIFRLYDISVLRRLAQIYLALTGTLILILMLFSYKRVKDSRKKRMRFHLFGLPVLAFLFIIDFIRYDYLGNTDGATFSRLGTFVYLSMISFEILLQFMKRISMGTDSEIMKNIAYCDALTCMGNRTSFMKKIHEISKDEYEGYGIAMFDLNNLKVFNDVHGHSAGDYYLIISSEIIRDIFGQKGETYRIGGDEFCAVLKDCSLEEFMKGAHDMQERLSQLKGPYTKEEMSIAYGYERYDKKFDNDLSNTMERADSSMYIVKEKLKKEIKN